MTTAKECKLRCQVRPGLFGDEHIVRFKAFFPEDDTEKEVECLAYGDSIELKGEVNDDSECSASLKAYVIGTSGDSTAVVLPQPTFQNGPSVVVKNTEIIAS